jgi:hypothetical protein
MPSKQGLSIASLALLTDFYRQLGAEVERLRRLRDKALWSKTLTTEADKKELEGIISTIRQITETFTVC